MCGGILSRAGDGPVSGQEASILTAPAAVAAQRLCVRGRGERPLVSEG